MSPGLLNLIRFPWLIERSPLMSAEPVIFKVLPSKVKLASPFSASAELNVAILLSLPLATAETAPPPPGIVTVFVAPVPVAVLRRQ